MLWIVCGGGEGRRDEGELSEGVGGPFGTLDLFHTVSPQEPVDCTC